MRLSNQKKKDSTSSIYLYEYDIYLLSEVDANEKHSCRASGKHDDGDR